MRVRERGIYRERERGIERQREEREKFTGIRREQRDKKHEN